MAPGARLALRTGRQAAPGQTGRWLRTISRLAVPVVLVAVWQYVSVQGWISPRTLESPQAVVDALVNLAESGVLWDSLVASFDRAAAGLLIGGGLGLVLGLVVGLSSLGERTFDALLQMLRMVPFLAVIPLFVIWFGVGEAAKILLIALACIFPMYINTFAGVRGVDGKLIEAAVVFGMRPWAIARRIVVPMAMPSILVGVRYAMGVALLSLVAAEQVNASSGIGYLALNPRASLRTDIILAVVIVYALLGLSVDVLVRGVQHVALPWYRTVLGAGRP
jgi:sulfonate transport system permease protein